MYHGTLFCAVQEVNDADMVRWWYDIWDNFPWIFGI